MFAGSSLDYVSIILLGHVRLVVLGQMSLLPKTLATKRTCEGLLTRMRAYVHIHRVLILESLGANGAVVQRTFLSLRAARGGG